MPMPSCASSLKGSSHPMACPKGIERPGVPPPASQVGSHLPVQRWPLSRFPRRLLATWVLPCRARWPLLSPLTLSPLPDPCCADPISAYNICQAGQLGGRRVVLTERGVAEQLARGTIQASAPQAPAQLVELTDAESWHLPAQLQELCLM